ARRGRRAHPGGEAPGGPARGTGGADHGRAAIRRGHQGLGRRRHPAARAAAAGRRRPRGGAGPARPRGRGGPRL
ncbi:MAG: hypothetical protein AVDCRST_MAG19-4481, partial [uncultured Thermomicrobiales bacterium]